ncbi:unnamed protein product [Linum tenue]|uniref:N-alpha-acetyltransferase 40 n=1 Tax=Linum tenue TaxID=586396 RepID=A0AAV0R3I2_9ROSI|nr:unnamed protein product [Linum tenue]
MIGFLGFSFIVINMIPFRFEFGKANMEGPFGEEWPEEEKVKRREMVSPEARYIFVKEESPEADNDKTAAFVGFVHFRFTLEEEIPVLYVYEIQLESRVQGKGLGKFLMQLVELIARKSCMSAVVLTVQKANVAAMNFYTSKLRYTISSISPSRVDPLMGAEKSYEILCKAFDREAKVALEVSFHVKPAAKTSNQNWDIGKNPAVTLSYSHA